MKYESTILKRLIDTYGVVGNPRYISEIIKEFIVRGKECFPNLFTYQADWLAHIDEFGLNPTYTVSYTGQSIYAPNTLERPVKSAILKGQTLVNLLSKSTMVYQNNADGEVVKEDNKIILTSKSTRGTNVRLNFNAEVDKTYTLKCKVSNNDNTTLRFLLHTTYNPLAEVPSGETKVINFIFSPVQVSLNMGVSLFLNFNGTRNIDSKTIIEDLVILEGDYANADIPYFEGMQSVKMPVLMTTGKNLFNENLPLENGYIDGNGNKTSSALYEWINQEHFVDGGEPLIISYKNRVGNATVRLAEYGETGFIKRTNLANNKTKITLTANTKRVILSVDKGTTYFEELQIEYGTVATIYEPYKSNILTVNEPIELRGIGDVKDELNLLTGELTQNIAEAVLSTFESYAVSTSNGIYYMAKTKVANDISPSHTLIIGANKFISKIYSEGGENFKIQVSSKEDGTYPTRAELSEYLTQNPLILCYIPTTSTIKTVDLSILDQNGQNVKQLMSFSGGTHINTGSLEGSPLPSVSVSVETDLEETLMVCSLDGNTM